MNKKHILRSMIIIIFCIYCVLLVYFLFLNTRVIPYSSYWDHIKRSINLIPFKTVTEYITRISNNTINLTSFIYNTFGNLFLFMPMGSLLPCVNSKINTLSRTCLMGFSIILCVEVLQLFSTLGTFDIDDIILNMVGLILGYSAIRIRPINYFLQKYNIIY